MIIHYTSSLLILLRAFQRSYSGLLGRDTGQGGQAKPKPKQAATQRRDGDGAACPCPEGKMANPIRDIHQYAFIDKKLMNKCFLLLPQ
jgi:hypothetical protein